MIDMETQNFLHGLKADISPCGSRITCNPPPLNTDEDFLVSINQDVIAEILWGLCALGYVWEGSSEHYQSTIGQHFSSFRKGSINLIVSANPDFVHKHKVATAICKRLNLRLKHDRITIFQAVLYGNLWDKP